MFNLTCPRCKAEPDAALLEVVSGTFSASGLLLSRDGFATMDARRFDTSDEKVACRACGDRDISLGECLPEEA